PSETLIVSLGLAAVIAAVIVEKMLTPGVRPGTLAGWLPPVEVNSVPAMPGVLSTHRVAGTVRSSKLSTFGRLRGRGSAFLAFFRRCCGRGSQWLQRVLVMGSPFGRKETDNGNIQRVPGNPGGPSGKQLLFRPTTYVTKGSNRNTIGVLTLEGVGNFYLY